MKRRDLFWFTVGVLLLVASFDMWEEKRSWEELVKGTSGRNALVGGAVGAVGGGAAGAVLGGVGVAAAGTGIGIPVAVVCLLGAAIFGVAGAAVGSATGSEDQIVTHVTPAYKAWHWATVMAVGGVLVMVHMKRMLMTTLVAEGGTAPTRSGDAVPGTPERGP